MNTGDPIFRLSRISHPRATVWAMALLALVFLFFGLIAEARLPEIAPTGGDLVEQIVGDGFDRLLNTAGFGELLNPGRS